MSKLGLGKLIAEEVDRRGVDVFDLATMVLSAADMARDETIDERRRELAVEAGCVAGELIVEIRRTAAKRQKAAVR